MSNSVGPRWYLRLGPKNDGYNSSVHLQVQAESFIPPRMKTVDLTSFRQGLKFNTRAFSQQEVERPQKRQRTAEDKSTEEEESEKELESDNGEGSGDEITNSPRTKYSLLHSLGIDTDLGVSTNFTRVKTLIGELFALQQEYTDTKSTVEYHQMQ